MSTSTDAPDASRPTDQEILDYERKLKQEMTGSQPLVGDLTDLTPLRLEYAEGAAIFQKKIEALSQTHPHMRSIKKDGNCFYRAFCFAFCESYVRRLCSGGDGWCRVALKQVEGTRELLKEAGYDPIVSEDFYEPFRDALNVAEPAEAGGAGLGCEEAVAKLIEIFRTEYTSDTIVCYMRLVTAALLKTNRDLYEAFILDSYPSLDAFIASQVEPMNIESDQIHIVAMANALKVSIKVADLDTSDSELNYHELTPMDPMQAVPVKDQPVITLLYRPGHYDIVYA
ncbi:OTU domain, ubiquitin aldehyde binding [Dinochytrium kinnereticum]|nr:OTU domain, ubiquitin aldehyde binding [Dinochytrium kinnereticum]